MSSEICFCKMQENEETSFTESIAFKSGKLLQLEKKNPKALKNYYN